MKMKLKLCILTVSILLILQNSVQAQKNTTTDFSKVELIRAAKAIINAAGVCALITLDENGNPTARAMDGFPPEDDLTIWFGTNPKSRKVQQIKNDSTTTLYFLDKDVSGYVLLQGHSELVDDDKIKSKYWKDSWKAFYPNSTEDYILIKFVPETVEVVSETRGILSKKDNWQPHAFQLK